MNVNPSGSQQELTPIAVRCVYDGVAWSSPHVSERIDTSFAVASACVQYGFSVFEGLKAYRQHSGGVALFLVEQHAQRFTQSARRLGLPQVPESLFIEACEAAMIAQAHLVPAMGAGSLYLRPLLAVPEERLGLRIPQIAELVITAVASQDPLPAPKRLWVETDLVRAWPGGVGAVKTAANYSAGLMGLIKARQQHCDDVLWLDGRASACITEASTSNVFLEIGGIVLTPRLNDQLLPGITRWSAIAALQKSGIPVREIDLSLGELLAASRKRSLGECFLTGTLSGITPVECIQAGGVVMKPTTGKIGEEVRGQLASWQRGDGHP